MRVSIAVATLGLSASLLVSAPSADAAGGAAVVAPAIADTVSALYQMNEPAGATVMTDSSGNGNNGSINPTGLHTGAVFDGATGYLWDKRPATAPPAHPERVISVADDSALEPGDQDFTLEIRYRTSNPYGNIIQKGQARATGGQWKVQLPGGSPSCLFQGIPDTADPNDNQIATSTTDVIDDNQWHTLRCEFSFIETTTPATSRVDLFIDGVFKSRKNGFTGPIDNNAPMTVGGKLNCDQVDITCDYFDGQIDYVKLSKTSAPPPVNQPPDAVMPPPTCSLLVCSFSSAGSTDPDGSIASYAWTFGDGTTSTAANPNHTFAAGGTFPVKLTVTDNDGGTDSATRNVTVAAGVAPSKPRQPSAVAGDRSAQVSWLKSSLPGTSPISSYTVTSSPDVRTCTTGPDTLTCTITGLSNEQPYTFTVKAVSAAGTSPSSDVTTPVTPIGKPLAPPTVAAVAGNGQAAVNWSAANGNGAVVTSYVITRSSGGSATVVPASALSAVLAGLVNGTSYRFSVAAVSVHGTGPATWSAPVTPAGRPVRPSHVGAKAGVRAAIVTWKPGAYTGAAVTRYTIVASNARRVSVSGARLSVRFPGLVSGRVYSFRVIATNRFGPGPSSTWSRKVRVR